MPEVPCRLITSVNLWLTLHVEHSGSTSASERAVVFAVGQYMKWGDNGGTGCFATPAEVGRTACLSENIAQQRRSALRAQGWLYPCHVNGRRTTYSCAVPDAVWEAFLACDEHGRCQGDKKDDAHLRRCGPVMVPAGQARDTPFYGGGIPRQAGEASPVPWGTNSPLERSTERSNNNPTWSRDDPWVYMPTLDEEPPF